MHPESELLWKTQKIIVGSERKAGLRGEGWVSQAPGKGPCEGREPGPWRTPSQGLAPASLRAEVSAGLRHPGAPCTPPPHLPTPSPLGILTAQQNSGFSPPIRPALLLPVRVVMVIISCDSG